MNLQSKINATPDGGTLNLGNAVYDIDLDPNKEYPAAIVDVRHDLTIIGNGAQIRVRPSTLRHRPALLVRGKNVKLLGDVTIVGPRPNNAGWDASREAQHGIETQGAVGFKCEWTVKNVYGNSLSAGKRVTSGKPDRWSSGLDLDMHSIQAGRQHINFDAAEHVRLKLQGDTCVRSAVDIEPPGSKGGCRDLYWYDSDLRGHFFFALANKGAGSDTSCSDIHLDGVRCHGQAFGVRVVPVTGSRRQRYTLENCSSDVTTHIPTLTFWHVDGIVIRNITQPIDKGVELARFNDCTNFVCPYPYVAG